MGSKGKEARGGRGTRWQCRWEKPYLNSHHGASGGYSKAFTGFSQGGCMVGRRRVFRGWVAGFVGVAVAGATAASGGAGAIRSPELREWLTYVSSDELEGRAVFTTGFGLAAAYISDHLRAWGVAPAGGRGSYLQTVRVLGVKTTSHASVSVTVNGETRTFADGDGITF